VTRLILIGAVLMLVSACTSSPLFSEATAVRIVSPAELAVVQTPVALQWQATNVPPGTRFAVFIDRVPVHPGQNLRDITDLSCRHTAGCPDAARLATYGVLLTSGDSVSIPDVGQPSNLTLEDEPAVHRATIVLVDPADHRLGESSYSVDFRVQASSD